MGTPDRIKILIVEDEGITAQALSEALTERGYEVVGIAASGWAGIEQAMTQRPDLVVMDIRLKGPVDGITASQRIQAQLDIPVVYLTAYTDDETLKRVLHSRAHGFVVKPVDADELHHTIAKALNMHRIRRGGRPGGR